MKLPHLAFDWRFLGWSLAPAWIFCTFSTDALFSTQAGSGILSSPMWLAAAFAYALSAAVSGIVLSHVGPARARWIVWAGAACVAIGTLLAAVSSAAADPSLPALVAEGVLCGTGLAWISLMWGFPLSTLSVEQIESALLLYAGVSAVCAVVFPLMPATAGIIVVACLPLASGMALLSLYPRGGATGDAPIAASGESSANRHRFFDRYKTVGAVYLMCFAAHIAIGYIDTVAGNLCGTESLPATTLAGAVVGIAFAAVAVMRSIRIDVYPLLRWTIPLLCAATALGSFWPACAASIELACVVCTQAMVYAYFVDQSRRGTIGLMPGLGIALCSTQLGINLGAIVGTSAFASVAAGSLPAAALAIECLLCLSMTLLPVLHKRNDQAPVAAYEELEAQLPAELVGVCDRYGLTPRERDVFAYLVRGRSQPYIREALLLSKSTVATHVRHIYEKFGVHARSELIELVHAHEEGGSHREG